MIVSIYSGEAEVTLVKAQCNIDPSFQGMVVALGFNQD